ncbi:unnamed protein product [Diatraea saccharalis]|uniref:BEN domain-containing protein n=1 Tax=Diatraea saccharalis TaxID=40085 RepID=A0A9N9WFS9_9NEOP|nr:unnamed protein product [Diatraea saccharalis]
MRGRQTNNGKLFYVVQFIELPFVDIDTYVCVPDSWIISRPESLNKVVVAYPNNEDSLNIRDRVKNEEKPNQEWRLHMAVVRYESDTFDGANRWIAAHNGNKSCEIESSEEDMRDSQTESMLIRKLRSASRPFFADTKFSKPSLSVKPYKNRRKALPRITIRLPSQSLKKKVGLPRVKLDKITNAVGDGTNHPRTVSEHSKRKKSIIISSNQLIQRAQTGKAVAMDNKTSFEHIFPHQSASPKLPQKIQSSPAGQIEKKALSLTDTDAGFDDNHQENDIDDHVESESVIEEAQFLGRTPAHSPEQVPQPVSVNERSTPLVYHIHSLPEPRLQDAPARQPKEADAPKGTQLLQMLTAPTTVSRPFSRSNPLSQGNYPQWALLPSTSAGHQTPRLQGTHGDSSTEVTLSHQRPNAQGSINKKSSLPYSVTNPINPSAKSFKKKSSPATENPAVKRMCFRNITRNQSALDPQPPLFNNPVVKLVPLFAQRNQNKSPQKPIRATAIDLSTPQQNMTVSAAQNLSYLAQHSRSLVEQPDIRRYLFMQKTDLEKTARLNSQFEQHNIEHSTGRHVHLPGATNDEFTLQSEPNPFSQTIPRFPQHNNQYGLLNKDNMQEVQRHEFARELIGGAHTKSAIITQNFGNVIQFSRQNSQSRSHYHFENPPRRQELADPLLKLNANTQKTERPGVIERSPAQPKTQSQPLSNVQRGYSHQDPRVRARLGRNLTEHQISDPVVSGNLVDRVEPTTVDTEVQTAPLPDRLDEMPFTLQPGIGVVFRNPRTKKLVVDQATEMDPAMDVYQCEDGSAESAHQSAPQVAHSGCQADRNCVEEQESPFQETGNECEISIHDVELDRGECDHPDVDTASESRPASQQKPQMQQRLAVEQEMLNMYGTLFNQMGASFHYTRDLFNHLRNSILKCAEVYESMLEKIETLNKVEQLPISTSLSNVETSKAPKENVAENRTGISSGPKINHQQKNAWVLPPEYDPNNPKWTRKYQKKAPGLVELIPRTNVYVNKKELANCKRESKDCRTLARLLLTEVFSADALGVCSLTGSKAKAFTSMNLEVRPGLDEDARMVLLTFVERYGAKRGWRTDDTSAIISSIRTKILEMRAKYSQAGSD